jgi:hypothetical protein
MAFDIEDYLDNTIRRESGGDPTATNPRSSAGGVGQFIDSTWLDQIRQARPDLAAGRSSGELLAMKTDPQYADLQRDVMRNFTQQNANTLKASGFDVNPGNLYLAHFAGPGGATSILGSDPSTPIERVMGASAIRANPFLAGKTAGDVVSWAAGTGGSGALRQLTRTAMAAPAQMAPSGILGQAASSLAAPDKDNSDPMGILARNAPGQPAAHQREDDMPAMKFGGLLSQPAPRQARPFQLSFNRGRRAFG